MTTTPSVLEAEIIEVPVPADVRVEWVTATVPIHDWIVTSWVQGTQTYRHGLSDVRIGEGRVLAGLRVLLAASGPYPGVDQELMVFDAEALTLRATAPFPDGLASARTIPGAIIAAGPNMGRAPRIARLPWSGAE